MSEKVVAESGQPVSESGSAGDVALVVDRSAEEYARRVIELAAENKKRKAKEQALAGDLEKAMQKLAELEESKTKEQGEYKQLFEKTKGELEAERKSIKETKANYAWQVVTSQIATAAAKAGCVDTDALIKLAGSSEMLSDIESDDSFNVPQDQIKSLIEKAQGKWTYLFGKSAPAVRDGTPATKPAKVSLKDIPLADRIKMLAQHTVDGTTDRRNN